MRSPIYLPNNQSTTARLSTTTYVIMPNHQKQNSQHLRNTRQSSSIPVGSISTTLRIPIFDHDPKHLESVETYLSKRFKTKSVSKAGSAFYVNYDRQGSDSEVPHDFSELESWSGSVVSVSHIALEPLKYDNGDVAVSTAEGGAVILWHGTASSAKAFEVRDGSIEFQPHDGDGTVRAKDGRLRIKSGTGNSQVVSPWIKAEETFVDYCGKGMIWEWKCGEEKEVSTA